MTDSDSCSNDKTIKNLSKAKKILSLKSSFKIIIALFNLDKH